MKLLFGVSHHVLQRSVLLAMNPSSGLTMANIFQNTCIRKSRLLMLRNRGLPILRKQSSLMLGERVSRCCEKRILRCWDKRIS